MKMGKFTHDYSKTPGEFHKYMQVTFFLRLEEGAETVLCVSGKSLRQKAYGCCMSDFFVGASK